jgi:hypothetical protein
MAARLPAGGRAPFSVTIGAWQSFTDPARFVFLDETGTATNMARRYGRSPGGERLVAAVPHGHVWTPPSGARRIFRQG